LCSYFSVNYRILEGSNALSPSEINIDDPGESEGGLFSSSVIRR